MTTNESPAEPASSRGIGMMLLGCLLGLEAALHLAWDGVACTSLLDMLFARPPFDVTYFGTRLVRVSWAPIGVAAGTALTLLGLQQAKRRGSSSTASSVLVLLSAIFAGIGAFWIASGIQQVLAVLTVIMTMDARMSPESIQATIRVASIPVSRGWMLLAVAQVLLAVAAFAQTMTRSKSSSPLRIRPMEDLAAIVLLGLFAIVVSWSWFFNGLAIERIRHDQQLKASEVVAQLIGVLSSTVWGAWALLAASVVMAIAASAGWWKAPASNR